MKAALATALRESCGYLEDEGWHQTAELIMLAAEEIDRLNAQVLELGAARSTSEEMLGNEDLRAPDASNQNDARRAIAAARR